MIAPIYPAIPSTITTLNVRYDADNEGEATAKITFDATR